MTALVTAWILAGGLMYAQSVSNPRTVTISPDGTGANFSNLQDAMNSITTASATNPFVILAYPGIYTGFPNGGPNVQWKSYVSLRGLDRNSTIIRGGGAGEAYEPLLNLTGLTGIEISNITLDGSVMLAGGGNEETGSTAVCGATVTFSNVTYINGGSGALGDSLVSGIDFSGQTCTTAGSVIVQDSDMVGILDGGGNWLVRNSNIHGSASTSGTDVYAYARFTYGVQSPAGTTTIVGSKLTATGTSANLGIVFAVIESGCMNSGPLRITGSVISAASTVSAPGYETSAIWDLGFCTDTLLVEGSVITYESVTGATSGTFYGVHLPNSSGSPLDIRGSVIRSVGTGGTRADVQRDDNTSTISLAGVNYTTVGGAGAPGIATADFRQGQFSADLTIPLTTPTASSNGKLWVVPANNQLCFRSGGAQYCVTGGGFMKVSQIGTSPSPGNLVCLTVGNKREGQAAVTIVSRDTGVAVANATVTGNWSGATTQNGVTAVTNTSGVATFTSAQASPGGVFTFAVTNVAHSPDFYDSSSNVETSDSTPTCN